MLWRIVQGLGGGALQPTQQAILRQTFPPDEQGMAMAMFSMVIMIGPAVGPVLGGWITDNYSWPWIFYINLPVGIIGILMTMRNVHEPDDVRAANRARAPSRAQEPRHRGHRADGDRHRRAAVPVRGGPAGRLVRLDEIRIAAFIAAVALVGFVIRELTATAPVVDLRMFKDPTFA